MVKKLPTINYKGKKCVVDFRLGEMRCKRKNKEIKFIKFTSLKEGKYSKIKTKLRGLRFRNWHNEHIPGIDT